MTSEVMTVLGPVPAEELGRTLPHEHLLFNLFRGFQPHREFLLHDEDLAAHELERFVAAGGGTIVELSTPDLGRNAAGLRRLAERTGLHIVMGAGRYRELFYEPQLEWLPLGGVIELLEHDVFEGEDGIRPGILGEIGTDQHYVSPLEERVHRAVARMQRSSGLSVSLHANASDVGLAQLDILEDEGVDLQHVAVGHCDTYPVLEYHLEILRRGAWVEYDTIRGTYEYETERQARLVLELVERGHIDRILLSQDMASNRFLTAYGGPGFDFVLCTFRELLLSRGLSADEFDRIVVDNPRRFLSGEAGS